MINVSNFRSVMCAQSVRSENRLVGMKITINYERLAKEKSKDEIIKAGDVEGEEMRRTDDLYLIYIYIYIHGCIYITTKNFSRENGIIIS